MGKLFVLNALLLAVLVVNASARNTYDKQDQDIDAEIADIARALADGGLESKRQEGEDEPTCDDACDIDEEGNCDCQEGFEECCMEYQRELQEILQENENAEDGNGQEQENGAQKKFVRFPRFRIPRIRIPRIRVPRIRFPRIRFPRFRPRFPFGKK